MAYIAYVETPSGVWRETDGVMDGPFTRADLGLPEDTFIRGCGTLRARGAQASISFGFGFGNKADNSFKENHK